MDWTPQQLRAFQAVARTGTMTQAAHTLGYTVGAVSQQIANLETSIGQKLFTRLPRTLVLTDTGDVFLRQSAHILESYSRASAALEQFTPDQEISLRLGAFSSAAVAYLPRVLEKLQAEAPHINVRMHETDIADASDALMRGGLDLALSVNYPNIPMPTPKGVTTTTLHQERFSLVTGRAEPLSIDELNDVGWILPPEESYFGTSVRLALHHGGITPHVQHVIENHVAAVAMAEAGYGVTPVTATTIALSNRHSAHQPFPGDPHRNIVLFTTAESQLRPSVHTLGSVIREVVSETAVTSSGS